MSDTVMLFAEAWKAMVRQFPSHRVEEGDGVTTCFGNVPLIFFNINVADRPAATIEELRGLLQTAAARSKGCANPSAVLIREDWMPEGWEQAVQTAGLAQMMHMTGMEGGELLPPRRPAPEIEIRRVADDAGARDLALLNAVAYNVPSDLFECMANMGFWNDESLAFVGYVDGKAVSTASVLPVGGTVYVALVATHPEQQGKGYAEAVMRHAVTEGQKTMGVMRTTLHATDMGQPVYRAMGYSSGPKLILFAPAH